MAKPYSSVHVGIIWGRQLFERWHGKGERITAKRAFHFSEEEKE
jgi:hypothetical protein